MTRYLIPMLSRSAFVPMVVRSHLCVDTLSSTDITVLEFRPEASAREENQKC